MLFLFGLTFTVLFFENYALKDTFKFVENLKQDLRRNNDDYAQGRRSITQKNNTFESIGPPELDDAVRYKIITTRGDKKITKSDHNGNKIDKNVVASEATATTNNNHKEDTRIKIIDKISRRVNDALISKELMNLNQPQKPRSQPKGPYNTGIVADINRAKSLWMPMYDVKNKEFIKGQRINLLPNKTNVQSLIPTLRPLQPPQTIAIDTAKETNKLNVKRDKMEKLQKFIQKNKGLLKEFISSKKEAARMILTTAPTPIAHTQHKPAEFKQVLRQGSYNFGKNDQRNLEKLPNANMLDMFPAKGGRVHSKRVKGRLCSRSVLIPEGPKYDSAGRVYLLPHFAGGSVHEYNATDAPRLLLPRCCNCCRKSVLGCE